MLKQLLNKRLPLFAEFLRAWIRYTSYVQEVIGTLILILLLGGVLIWRYEDLSFGDAIYFTFITGLTVGYGDITPKTTIGKIVSICIGIIGVLFVGISVAIANRALTDTAKHHYKLNNKEILPDSSPGL